MNQLSLKQFGERGIELGKTRSIWTTKLGIKLIVCVAISFFLSIGFYIIADYIGSYYITNYLDTAEHERMKTDKLMTEFQQYVTQNQLTIYDTDIVNKWIGKQKNIDIYCSGETQTIKEIYQKEEKYEGSIISGTLFDYGLNAYEIKFADTAVYCYPILYDADNYYKVKLVIVLLLTLFWFLGWFLMFIRKRIFYITQLANDMKILEAGDLNYKIYLPGNDELAYLANSIDEMRLSVIQKMENESKAVQANNELITAMSHDLRTPLTKQIGYLDIIEYEKYFGDEQRKDYIHKARENAYKIKEISDQLFRYFLAFDTKKEESNLEIMKGEETINPMLIEQVYYLESQGFLVDRELFYQEFQIKINAQELYRVFDNMFSNIKKYAEKEDMVLVKCFLEGKNAVIEIKNTIWQNQELVESTKIGLKISAKLLEKFQGELIIDKTLKEHYVKMRIPLYE